MIKCIYCGSEYGYPDGTGFSCPECGQFWTEQCLENMKTLDSVGNILEDGDTVVTIKDLKLGKQTIKRGTKAVNIKIIEPLNGHDIDAKCEGFGAIYLKSSVVKKIN